MPGLPRHLINKSQCLVLDARCSKTFLRTTVKGGDVSIFERKKLLLNLTKNFFRVSRPLLRAWPVAGLTHLTRVTRLTSAERPA